MLNDILEKFPEIYKSMQNKIEEREEQNRAREKAKEPKVDEPSRILKDLDTPLGQATQQNELEPADPGSKKAIDLEGPKKTSEEEIKSTKTLKPVRPQPEGLALSKDKSTPLPKNDKKDMDSSGSKLNKPSQQISQVRIKKSIAEIDNKLSEPIKLQKGHAAEDLKMEGEEEKKEHSAIAKRDTLFDTEDSRMKIDTVRGEQEVPNLPIGQVQNPTRISFIAMELSRIEPPSTRQGEDKSGRKEYAAVLRDLDENKQDFGIIESHAEYPVNPKLNETFMASLNTFYSQSIGVPFTDQLGMCCRKVCLKIKGCLKRTFQLYKKYLNELIVYLIVLFNFFWIPAAISFQNDIISYKQGWSLGMEGVTIVVFFVDLVIMFEDRKLQQLS